MGLKEVVLGIAILILTMFVVIYGINIFMAQPEYGDFCGEFRTQEIIENQNQCEAVGGQWTRQEIKCITEPCPQGYCDRDYTCRMEYEDANERYSRNIFLIALPIGIILLALGALVFGLESVGAGLMAGGVGVILYGVGGFWRFADDWLKFILSLIGLVIVIWLAYFWNGKIGKKNKSGKKPSKKRSRKKRR